MACKAVPELIRRLSLKLMQGTKEMHRMGLEALSDLLKKLDAHNTELRMTATILKQTGSRKDRKVVADEAELLAACVRRAVVVRGGLQLVDAFRSPP